MKKIVVVILIAVFVELCIVLMAGYFLGFFSNVEEVVSSTQESVSQTEEVIIVPKEIISQPKETPQPVFEEQWELKLVNFENSIEDDFVPQLAMSSYGYQVDYRIIDDLDRLMNGAVSDDISLIICYGYRTFEQSQELFDKQLNKQLSYGLSQEKAYEEARKWVALPGTSDHHTGLAVDIVTASYQVLNYGFADTPAAIWMAENAHKYGFVIRYPYDKQDITRINFEPWHLRYVGVENATAMKEKNLCLEEYIDLLKGK